MGGLNVQEVPVGSQKQTRPKNTEVQKTKNQVLTKIAEGKGKGLGRKKTELKKRK